MHRPIFPAVILAALRLARPLSRSPSRTAHIAMQILQAWARQAAKKRVNGR